MAKDRRKLQHIHSSIADKQPTPQSLEVGEIAVNNAATKEFLSIKNSGNKVVRFSSDAQMINWVERKEVIPYSGTVDNVHLDTNRSNIEIKLNQVVASATTKHNVVNGAKDIDGNLVNPTTDSGVTNGAGFAIDMSRYAMIGANPSFSSVTVTHQSNLSGTTNISNGAGGTALNITTTSVSANDTNWSEIITNKTSKITTLAESATTATLSGNTLDITEATRISAKTPSTSVSGTNLSIVETNTDINSCGRISGKTNAYSMEECATGGTHTEKFHTSTISGTNLNVTEGTSTINSTNTNLTGTNLTIKESATTLSSTTTTISGGTLTQTTTGATTVNVGGNLTENVTGTTTINSTGTTTIAVTGSGNDLCLTAADVASFRGAAETRIGKTCANGGQSTTVNINGTTINETGATVNISGSSAANISGATVNVSGGTINEKSPGNITIESSGAQSKIDIKTTGEQGRLNLSTEDYLGIYSGRDIVINVGDTSEGGVYISGNTDISGNTICEKATDTAAIVGASKTNVGKNCSNGGQTTTLNLNGNTINETGATVNISGSSTANISGATVNVSGGSINETSTGTTCIAAGTTAAIVGATKTNIGKNCSDGGQTTTLNINGTTINETGTTVNISGTTTNVSGGTINVSGGTITETSTGKTCIQASTDVNIGGDTNTNIGAACDGSVYSNNVGISAQTAVTISAPTINLTGGTVYGLKNLTIQYGTNVSNRSSATTYNGSAANTVDVPTTLAQISNGVVSDTNAASTTAGQINITKNVSVTGTITASGAIYSSDRNLKENIQFVKRDEFNKVANIFAKSYNFKSDENKSKMYGVIAQDVQEAGFPELVHTTDDNGTLGVDYTSLFILKIAYLEDFCAMLNGRIVGLENRIKELENKG